MKRLPGGKLEIRNSKRRKRQQLVAEIKKLTQDHSITHVDPLTLKSNPNNARVRTDRHVLQIGASIDQFGFLNPILADQERNVLAGHGRLAAALKLGVPVANQIRAY